MADFGTMIQALMSTDNALRGQAEAMYQQLLQDSLDATVGNLLHMIRAGDAVSRARCPPADCAALRHARHARHAYVPPLPPPLGTRTHDN